MQKKGFTLIEVLGSLAVVGILILIIYPVIDNSLKESKEKIYDAQINQIKKAASDWALKNSSDLPTEENQSINITLGALKQGGYIEKTIVNPLNEKEFPNDMFIKIKRFKNNYTYQVMDDESNYDDKNEYQANVILIGDKTTSIDINSTFEDKGIKIIDANGTKYTAYFDNKLEKIISNYQTISVKIYKNSEEVKKIDTSSIGTYKIVYSIVSNGTEELITRKVIVEDKTPPTLKVDNHTSRYTIKISKNQSFTIPSAVATDNVDGDITSKIEVTSNVNTSVVGTYYIKYSVSDNNNNIRSLTVTVIVQ